MIEKGILTTEYLLPISSLWLIKNAEMTLIEGFENYQKKSTRNRSKIMSPNGVEVLSVPLSKGKNSKMPISQVEISYDNNWVESHLSSIRTAYGNSPYYEHYIDDLSKILNEQYPLLFDLNSELTSFFIRELDIEKSLTTTKSYEKQYSDKCIDLRNTPFNYREINNYSSTRYIQVFEEKHGFQDGLSALDLLMCLGPEGILII